MYSYQTSANYRRECNASTSSDCTACDPLFYDPAPVSGTCILLANNIYNTTYVIQQNYWQYNIPVSPSQIMTVSGETWL
jgi:hypothetical protein